jgi:arylsulfatase A-like enzyme
LYEEQMASRFYAAMEKRPAHTHTIVLNMRKTRPTRRPRIGRQISSAVLAALFTLYAGCTTSSPPLGETTKAPACIILVTIDTLRADHLPMYGYPRATAPFLTELASNGIVFERAFSASSHTAPSHASLLTSLFPSQHGVRQNGHNLDESIPTIATELQAAGYRTAAFSSVDWLRDVGRGFEHFSSNRSGYRQGREIVADALGWLGEGPRGVRKFLWLHFFDVHEFLKLRPSDTNSAVEENYAAAAKSLEQDGNSHSVLLELLKKNHGVPPKWADQMGARLTASVADYDARIRYVDGQLQRLNNALPDFCESDEIRWFVTSDHGEGLMTAGRIGHGRYLHHEQLHVPLIYHATDLEHPGTRVAQLVRLVDLPATIAAVAGTAWPHGEGHSLIALTRGDRTQYPVLFNFAQRRPASAKRLALGWTEGEVLTVHDAEKRYILRTDAPDLFFDRTTDPFETNSLAGASHEEAAVWQREAIRQWERVQNSGSLENTPTSTNPRYRDQLRSLGYIE